MAVMTLSGWGQPADALAKLLPGADYFAYAEFMSASDALDALAEAGQGYDTLVGWSLGGQLLLRAVAAKLLAPERLVLIAAPYRFKRQEGMGLGMPEDTFEQFLANYRRNPARTLNKAWELTAVGDAKPDTVRGHFDRQDRQAVLGKNWAYWLEALRDFSADTLMLDHLPPTLLLHGAQDKVVAVEQAAQLAARIPKSTVQIWPEAGHAPHWHDAEKLRQEVMAHAV